MPINRYIICFVLLNSLVSCVQADCSIRLSRLNFGDYSVDHASASESTADIMATCAVGDSYSISLSAGNGSFSARKLRNDSHDDNFLFYNLFVNSSHSRIWGDGSSSTAAMSGTGNGSDQPHTVFGQIPSAQNVQPGQYADSITVTIRF